MNMVTLLRYHVIALMAPTLIYAFNTFNSTNNSTLWQSTTDFIPINSTHDEHYGHIRLWQHMKMSLDVEFHGRVSNKSLKKWEQMFRVGFTGYDGSAEGLGSRYPSLWLDNTDERFHLGLSQSGSPEHGWDFPEVTLQPQQTYSVDIEWSDTWVYFAVDSAPFLNQPRTAPTKTEHIGQLLNVYIASDYYSDPYVIANVTLQNIIIESFVPTSSPTLSTTAPTSNPTHDPTSNPTSNPTHDPTVYPTYGPTIDPTQDPTIYPTYDPTVDPTFHPTVDPTQYPTSDPTNDPSFNPTFDPTVDPTLYPTSDPTNDLSVDPTGDPTNDPTIDPTINPTENPSVNPTTEPTHDPTLTHAPTSDPTDNPTINPTNIPSDHPAPETTMNPPPTDDTTDNPITMSAVITSTEETTTPTWNTFLLSTSENPSDITLSMTTEPARFVLGSKHLIYLAIAGSVVCILCTVMVFIFFKNSKKTELPNQDENEADFQKDGYQSPYVEQIPDKSPDMAPARPNTNSITPIVITHKYSHRGEESIDKESSEWSPSSEKGVDVESENGTSDTVSDDTVSDDDDVVDANEAVPPQTKHYLMSEELEEEYVRRVMSEGIIVNQRDNVDEKAVQLTEMLTPSFITKEDEDNENVTDNDSEQHAQSDTVSPLSPDNAQNDAMSPLSPLSPNNGNDDIDALSPLTEGRANIMQEYWKMYEKVGSVEPSEK